MRGTVHHIDLTVRDPETSFPLYDAVLRWLGYGLEAHTANGFEWVHASLAPLSVSIVRARDDGRSQGHNRYAPGLHHLAWSVERRADVDDAYALLQGMGARILDAPAEYPQYNRGRGYYAVFFADDDGLKLEIVCTAPQ